MHQAHIQSNNAHKQIQFQIIHAKHRKCILHMTCLQ